jgi:hypothetical protein
LYDNRREKLSNNFTNYTQLLPILLVGGLFCYWLPKISGLRVTSAAKLA